SSTVTAACFSANAGNGNAPLLGFKSHDISIVSFATPFTQTFCDSKPFINALASWVALYNFSFWSQFARTEESALHKSTFESCANATDFPTRAIETHLFWCSLSQFCKTS